MIMSNADIVREYREAKTPMKQISILADLNCCKRKDIVEILVKEGCEVPKFYTKSKDKKEEPEVVATDINVGTKEPETVAEQPKFVAVGSETVEVGQEIVVEGFEPPSDVEIEKCMAFSEYTPNGDGEKPVHWVNDEGKEYMVEPNTCRCGREQELRDALSAIGDYGFEFRKDLKKIRSLSNGIRQLSQIHKDVDLSLDGQNAIMQAIVAFTEEINTFMYIIDDSMGAVDKIVINALMPKPKGEAGE